MRQGWNCILGGAAALPLLLSCGEREAAPEPIVAEVPGQVAIAGPGRPDTIEEATEGESDVTVWSVSDEDTLVYLIGTVHPIGRDIDWQNDVVKRAFSQADAVYLEADVLSREAQRAMGVVVSETAELRNGTLNSFYTAAEQEAMNEALSALGTDLSEISNYRPWFAAMQMAVVALIEAGGDPANNADVVISREMLLREVELRYLETAADQLALLASSSDDVAARYFSDLMEVLSLGERYYADLIGAWYEGDDDRVDFVANGILAKYPKLYERVVLDRNRDWAQKIDRLMADEPGTFVVSISAGHLVGENSVQKQLASRGYKPKEVVF